VARTWAELLTQERTLSEAETAWIAEIRQPEHTTAAADEFFNPPVSLFDSVIREALIELEQMAEALLEHGKLSPETLSAAIHAQASVWIQAQEEATRTERDTREVRAELTPGSRAHIEILIEKANKWTLQYLALFTFGQPHTQTQEYAPLRAALGIKDPGERKPEEVAN
jgi:hypothetical protein